MKDNADWFEWYWGLIPLVVLLIGTYIVYHLFWKEGLDITADVGGKTADEAGKNAEVEA